MPPAQISEGVWVRTIPACWVILAPCSCSLVLRLCNTISYWVSLKTCTSRSAESCSRDEDRDKTWALVSMATAARCTGLYAVQVIQPPMKSVHIRSAVFKCAAFYPLPHLQPLVLDATTWPPAPGTPLPPPPARVAGLIFPSEWIKEYIEDVLTDRPVGLNI